MKWMVWSNTRITYEWIREQPHVLILKYLQSVQQKQQWNHNNTQMRRQRGNNGPKHIKTVLLYYRNKKYSETVSFQFYLCWHEICDPNQMFLYLFSAFSLVLFSYLSHNQLLQFGFSYFILISKSIVCGLLGQTKHFSLCVSLELCTLHNINILQ